MDRQVRRMVTQRPGEESNNIESVEPVATSAIPSDSDEDKNETVTNNLLPYFFGLLDES